VYFTLSSGRPFTPFSPLIGAMQCAFLIYAKKLYLYVQQGCDRKHLYDKAFNNAILCK